MQIRRLIVGVRLWFVYLQGKFILKTRYSFDYTNSKYFKGGKYGEFTARGWQWVVRDYRSCRKLNTNQDVLWPVSPMIKVICPENIEFHPDDINNFQGYGNYYQGYGHIKIGKGTWIAPNVGIITANHDFTDLDKHEQPKPVILGESCWIGMNSVILPGVLLGPHTVVGAGSVVTHSFPDGHVVIAGNPAKIIKNIE